jgi:hypothetical protein
MERNRWETAIRCLEIAVHPNTSDKEVLAAINGFRRTASNTPLSQLWRESASPGSDGPTTPDWKGELDRLDQENRELRRKIKEIDDSRSAILRSQQEVEQRAREISEELLAAEYRADVAEQQLAEFRGAYGRISGGSRHENFHLRGTLEETGHNAAAPMRAPAPFQTVLNAALQRVDQAQVSPPIPVVGQPWTA